MRFGAACDHWWNVEGCKNVETGLKYRFDWLRDGDAGDKRADRFCGLGHKLLKDITPEDITEVKLAREKCVRPAGKGHRW